MLFNKEELTKRYNSLPPGLREALDSSEVYEELRAIASKHALLMDKSASLEEEVVYVLLGFVPSAKFPVRIKESLEISSEKAEEIAHDVNENVFKKFREALMGLGEEEVKEETVESNHLPLQKIDPAEPFVEDNKFDREEILKEIERLEQESNSGLNLQAQKTPTVQRGDEAFAVSGALDVKQNSGDIEKTTESADKSVADKNIPPSAKHTIDPYREPIE